LDAIVRFSFATGLLRRQDQTGEQERYSTYSEFRKDNVRATGAGCIPGPYPPFFVESFEPPSSRKRSTGTSIKHGLSFRH
jgi:hypothetical protein